MRWAVIIKVESTGLGGGLNVEASKQGASIVTGFD